MSPTINASSIPAGENPIYKFSHGRKNSTDSGSSDRSTASTGSVSNNSSGSAGVGLNEDPLKQSLGYAPVNAPYRRAAAGGRRGGEGGEEPFLGAARLTQLPDAFQSREGSSKAVGGADSLRSSSGAGWDDTERTPAGLFIRSSQRQDRSTFPASASVSIPTSTTTLDYLLHQHASSAGDSATDLKKNYSNGNTLSALNTPAVSSLSSPTSSTQNLPPVNGIKDYLSKYHSGSELGSGNKNADPQASPTTMMTRTIAEKGHAGPGQQQEHQQPAGESDAARRPKGPRRVHDPKSVGSQFFHVEPCLYTHRMFLRAAKIFEVLKSDETETKEAQASRRRRNEPEVKRKIPDMDFRDAPEQIKTFELTFATLKYQELFRDILEGTGFFHEFSNLRSDYSLVNIILFDLQSRKFQRRIPLPEELENKENEEDNANDDAHQNDTSPDEMGEEGEPPAVLAPVKPQNPLLDPVCLEIENALLSRKTRLQSNIAKERIKRNAPSIEHLLPEQVRHKDETKSLTPVFCWVNQMKTSIENMVEAFIAEGFEELQEGLDISEQKTSVFRRDAHCSDLLVFPPHLNMYFKESDWVKNGLLVQQDKSSCLAPQTVHLLLGIDQDVVHVNIGTGMTTGHIASLLRHRSPHSHIWAFGPEEVEKSRKVARNLEFLGAKNTKIIQENFLNVDPEDSRYKNVRVIMITANCSKSAITSPVQFIVSEGEDMQILGELSQADSNVARIRELTHEHEKLLRHALKFPRVQAVVYTTRSRYQAENQQVVHQVLEAVNGPQNGRRIPFKVSPPVLPFAGDEIGREAGIVDGRFACFRPTDKSNGCFVAIISREPEDPKETARSAIARARSKGMLGKGDSEGSTPDGRAHSVNSGKVRSRGRKPTTGSAEAKNSAVGLKQKLSNHKSPAAGVGARLYQAALITRMEQAKAKPHRPEHTKVIKHPAPFSEIPQALRP